jgi:hypothetical protein
VVPLAEAQFTLISTTNEKTKYCYVISQLDHRYAKEVEDIITSPPDPYSTLWTVLVRRLSPSREQRIRRLLMLEMGERKPSQLLRHLRSLAPDVPYHFLRSIWSGRLLPTYGSFSAHPEGDMDAADCITEAAPQPALVSVVPLPDSAAFLQCIEDLSRQVSTQCRAGPPSIQLQEPPTGQQIPHLR